ncbi:MAG TPA: terminase small subunit [Pyrinomonadaceae bacterium]|nr:terminase small subunit [Pyrinomonadaceae bacterium]
MRKKTCVAKAGKSREESLTLREKKFVEAMADSRVKTQTEAAIIAGYSLATARIIASQKLTKLNISEAIEQRKQKVIKHADITPEEVLGSAVFQMRSSIDDVINERGEFDLEKARATGAIDLVKKYRTLVRIEPNTGNKEILTEIELYSPADARKEVANYIILDGKTQKPVPLTDTELAGNLFNYLMNKGDWSVEQVKAAVALEFPAVDLNLLIL